MSRCIAIIQARLGSSRLPLKSLLCLRGSPLIDWVTDRLTKARYLDGLIVAVPDTPLDQVLMEHLQRRNIPCMAGPEDDVLERFRQAAVMSSAETIVRVCADNPLIWGEAIDRLIDFYRQSRCDYAYNHIPRQNRWPDGLGAEIFSRSLLDTMVTNAVIPAQREHCCNYIWDNTDHFRIATFDPTESWLCRPDIKLDVDKPDDFRRLALLPLTQDMDARTIIEVCSQGQ